jgi:hypothetical protein
MDKKINLLISNWQKRNIEGLYCPDKDKAREKIREIIPKNSTVGISGSQTLDALGIIPALEAAGVKVFNQYKAGLGRGESLELRKQGAQADYYLASPNAIAESGELVFFSAYGNRIAGISNAANVIIVAGMNKICLDLEQALKRARECAVPLNCKRLNWNTPCFKDGVCRKDICLFPEYKRMCCQLLIIEADVVPARIKVIIVEENLGF